jgi:murein L,D-transpeptidase YafK
MKTGDDTTLITGVGMKLVTGIIFIIGLFFMSGCMEQGYRGKVDNTPYATKECRKGLSRGTDIDVSSKIDKIVVYKKKRKLYTYRNGKKIDEFRISLGAKGGANGGDKVKVGDYRTPEGSYQIVRKKCDDRLYKSLMISYPNRADKTRAAKRGVNPGNYITIHGQPKWNADGKGDNYTLAHDWTEGCMAISNLSMDALWKAVQNGVKIDIHP